MVNTLTEKPMNKARKTVKRIIDAAAPSLENRLLGYEAFDQVYRIGGGLVEAMKAGKKAAIGQEA
jgi:hypothetical protein